MPKYPKVLLVDDDADDRALVRQALLECEEYVHLVDLPDGSDVPRYLEACPDASLPTVILLDINMPGRNGFEVLTELKSNNRYGHIPIYMLTTSSVLRDKKQSIDLGASGFFTKPNKYADLVKVICELVS